MLPHLSLALSLAGQLLTSHIHRLFLVNMAVSNPSVNLSDTTVFEEEAFGCTIQA